MPGASLLRGCGGHFHVVIALHSSRGRAARGWISRSLRRKDERSRSDQDKRHDPLAPISQWGSEFGMLSKKEPDSAPQRCHRREYGASQKDERQGLSTKERDIDRDVVAAIGHRHRGDAENGAGGCLSFGCFLGHGIPPDFHQMPKADEDRQHAKIVNVPVRYSEGQE